MISINLLPWREARRARRKKQFYLGLILLSLLATLLCFGIQMGLKMKLNAENQRLFYLTALQNKIMPQLNQAKDLEASKQALAIRLVTIQKQQAERAIPVEILNELASRVPSEVTLVSINRQGHLVYISGYASDSSAIAELIKQIDLSSLFDAPILKELKSENNLDGKHRFSIEASLFLKGEENAH